MSKYPLPTPADIDSKSKQLGFEIPKEYAEFLLTFNAGRPEKRVFKQSQNAEAFPDFVVKYFLGIDINDDDESCDLYAQYIDIIGQLPTGLLPIAYDSAENLLVLGTQNSNYNKVYKLLASDDPGYEKYTRFAPELLCNSFNEFLNALESELL